MIQYVLYYRLLYNVSPPPGPQLDFSTFSGIWDAPAVLFGRLMWQLVYPSTGNVSYDTTAKVSTHSHTCIYIVNQRDHIIHTV
jgi:hypothetical protein